MEPFRIWFLSGVIMGVTSIGAGTAEIYSGIRPAFCMGKQTAVKQSSDIVKGEDVYVIEEYNIRM